MQAPIILSENHTRYRAIHRFENGDEYTPVQSFVSMLVFSHARSIQIDRRGRKADYILAGSVSFTYNVPF